MNLRRRKRDYIDYVAEGMAIVVVFIFVTVIVVVGLPFYIIRRVGGWALDKVLGRLQ